MEQSFGVHCLRWDAVSALLFLPSYLSCPPRQLVSPLAALLPTPTLLTVLNIYTSVSLSPTLLPLCLLVTPLLSLLHSHSGALQVSRVTSFSSLLVNTYPCFSPRITRQPSYRRGGAPVSLCPTPRDPTPLSIILSPTRCFKG